MQPREIDALIAEHVMGLTVVNDPANYRGVQTGAAGREGRDLPNYSTDIAAAWQVVEALCKAKQCGVSVLMRYHIEDARRYRCSMSGGTVVYPGDQRTMWIDAPTAPMAICLAALAALGVEVPHEQA